MKLKYLKESTLHSRNISFTYNSIFDVSQEDGEYLLNTFKGYFEEVISSLDTESASATSVSADTPTSTRKSRKSSKG